MPAGYIQAIEFADAVVFDFFVVGDAKDRQGVDSSVILVKPSLRGTHRN